MTRIEIPPAGRAGRPSRDVKVSPEHMILKDRLVDVGRRLAPAHLRNSFPETKKVIMSFFNSRGQYLR